MKREGVVSNWKQPFFMCIKTVKTLYFGVKINATTSIKKDAKRYLPNAGNRGRIIIKVVKNTKKCNFVEESGRYPPF